MTSPTNNNTIKIYQLVNKNKYADSDIKIINQLLVDGNWVDDKDNIGCTALMYACSPCYNGTELAELLLAYDADINHAGNIWGLTPLMCACSNGRRELVELFLNKNADVNVVSAHNDNCNTALINY
jgi:ankyrin repeat protein